jgi:tetratricopeptide (TPR) repeat protein
MSFRYPHPDNERSFEKFCLKLLQRHWNNPHLELYGRRGEEQSGVDIIDPTFSAPFKAGQCKHHEPLLTIPPSEIEAEVAKALTFDPPLDHFAIVTSGRATTHAQNKIIEINREHRAKGLFIVELLWWEKIEDLLDEYPDVAALLTKITNAHIAALEEKVTQGFMTVSSQVEAVVAVSGQTARDGEIDEAESCLENSDPQRARILLEKLRQRHWEELTPQQKYRVKAAFSNAALVQGNDQEAGRLLLEAKSECPDSERAQINEALGLELVGKKAEAHALASQLREKYPSSGKLLAIYIRTAPGNPSLEELEALLSAATEKDAEVCTALAIRAMGMHQFSEAADFAKTAVIASPDWFGSRFILGQALYNAESVKLGRGFRAGSDPLVRARLVEAIAAIDEAIALAKKCHADHLLSQCFLVRALANALRCEDDAAEQDFNEATRTGPENRQAQQHFAMYLFHRNRMDEAIVELRKAVRGGSAPVAELLLADLLSERDKPGDRAEAIEIYARLALADGDPLGEREPDYKPEHLDALPITAFHSAVNEYIDATRLDEAEAFVGRVPPERFSEVGILTARSQLRQARGDFQGAVTAADGALRKVEADTHDLSLRALALQLGKLERHKDALPLWLRITQSAEYSNDVRHLVRCAERVQRYDVILSVAKAAREAGIQDTWLLFKEADVLGMFDLDGAVALLRGRIQKHPGDTDARLRLSHLGLKWRRLDLVDARLEALPSLDEVTATGGAIAVEILRQQGDPNEALRYAYELVRRHYDHPDANASLIQVFFSPNSRSLEIDEPVEAGPGAAVCCTENGGKERWIIIEDSPNPRPELNEYAPTHALAQSLNGKRVGDSVVLSKTSGRDRTAVIKEIKSKYLYRLHEIMDAWQVRFPDQPFVQVFRVASQDKTTGQEVPDFTDIKLVADRHYEQISDAESAYKTQLIPLHLLSEIAGCDPFRALYYVALRADLPVRCNQARQDEHDQALEALGSCSILVLDLTAIGSISLLRLEDLLSKWRGKFVVSQSTATELRSSLEDITTKPQGTGHFGKTEHGYFFQQYSEEGMKAETDALASLVQTVLDVCDVRGCPELAELDPRASAH